MLWSTLAGAGIPSNEDTHDLVKNPGVPQTAGIHQSFLHTLIGVEGRPLGTFGPNPLLRRGPYVIFTVPTSNLDPRQSVTLRVGRF